MSQYNCLDRQQVAQRHESKQAQKGFFFNNLGHDAQNKYAQGQVTPK